MIACMSKVKFEQLGHWLKVFDVGRNKVLARIQGTMSFALQIATYVAVIGLTTSVTGLIGLVVFITILTMLAGLFWVKSGIFDSENASNNLNNPQVMETLQRVQNIEKILSKLKKKK